MTSPTVTETRRHGEATPTPRPPSQRALVLASLAAGITHPRPRNGQGARENN